MAVYSIKEWQRVITHWAEKTGFEWNLDEHQDTDTMLLRLHSEVSEASEAWRDDDEEHFREECADIFIRLANMCEIHDFDLEEYVLAKMEKNDERPYRHGRKHK